MTDLARVGKARMILGTLLLILLFNTPYGLATTYYVRKAGNDNANGTSWATAWTSISKVNSTLVGGDTVYFGTGTWRGQINPVSGTSGDRTTYACSSFVQGIAHIWGSDSIGGWVQHSGNVYKGRSSTIGSAASYVCGQIGGGLDTILIPSTSIPTSAGHFYYNTSTDTVYVWLVGGGNPTGKDIELGYQSAVEFSSGQDYVTFWGFDLRYGTLGTVWIASGGCNYNYFDHCSITRAGCINQENASGFFTSRESPNGEGNRVRACTLGTAVDYGMDDWRFGLCLYTQNHFVVESCYVYGGVHYGLYFKENTNGCVMRFNTVKGARGASFVTHNGAQYDSIYGNIGIGTGGGGNLAGGRTYSGVQIYSLGSAGSSGNHFIANNTLYNIGYSGLHSGLEGTLVNPNYYRYNIVHTIYDISNMDYEAGYCHFLSGDSSKWTADSNMYYNPTTAFGINYSSRTLSYWENTLGLEVHAIFTNPNFADPTSGDFSRPSSSQEMNLTYGGKTWTRYGAWQPGDVGGDVTSPDTVKSVDTIQVNTTSVLLKCHRNDSADCGGYMVRYATGATSPASYNTGTFGDSTSSRNDTTFTVTGLSPNTQYSFSIFARDEVPNWSAKGSGSWKTVTTKVAADNTPPDTVKSVDTTSVSAHAVYLIYHKNDSVDCGGYMVKYATGATAPSTYNSDIFGDSTSSRDDTTLTVSGLLASTQYSFTVFARDEVPNWTTKGSQSSMTVRTRAENHCPTTPTPDLPADGDTILGLRPILSVNNSVDTDGDVLVYDFNVCSDSQMTNSLVSGADVSQGEGITYWQVTSDLPDESWYWWEARSYDAVCHSDWSGNRKFYVKRWIADVDDSQPVLKSPAEGAVLGNSRPTLQIYNITGFVSLWYYFQLASDSQFVSPVQSEAVAEGDILTSWTVSSILSKGNYCWKARAFDGSEFSLWSEVGKFTVVPEIYVYPNPFKPSAGDETIVFNNIPLGSDIKITTLNGEFVREFSDTQENQILWDAKNQKNEDVASGVYLYFVDFAGGSTSGKIVVIR